MIYKILLILATGCSLCFASESLTKKAKTINLMPPPLRIHVALPPLNEFSQDYRELLAKIMSLPTYPKKLIVSYLLGDGHLLRFISNRMDFPNYVLHHETSVCSVDINRESDKIVTGSVDGSVRIWDLTTKDYKELAGHTGSVVTVCFNATGDKIVTGSEDTTVRMWNLTTAECKVLAGHAGTVVSASFNATGDKIVTGSEDATVRVWDCASNDCRIFHGHRDHVNGTCFNEAGDKIASASNDSTVRFWDLTTGDYRVLRHAPDDWVLTIYFAKGDTKVVSTVEEWVMIWDLATGRCFKRGISSSNDWPTSINLTKNRAAVPWGHWILVFDITGDYCRICELHGHSDCVTYAKFDETGDKLVSASHDRTVRVWDFSVFERFKESCLIEWVLVLKAIHEVVIARAFKEKLTDERLAENQIFPTSHLDDMYFKFSMFGDTLKVGLETSYENLPPYIRQNCDGYIRKE